MKVFRANSGLSNTGNIFKNNFKSFLINTNHYIEKADFLFFFISSSMTQTPGKKKKNHIFHKYFDINLPSC